MKSCDKFPGSSASVDTRTLNEMLNGEGIWLEFGCVAQSLRHRRIGASQCRPALALRPPCCTDGQAAGEGARACMSAGTTAGGSPCAAGCSWSAPGAPPPCGAGACPPPSAAAAGAGAQNHQTSCVARGGGLQFQERPCRIQSMLLLLRAGSQDCAPDHKLTLSCTPGAMRRSGQCTATSKVECQTAQMISDAESAHSKRHRSDVSH